jgi:hypothetical protein
MLAFPGPQERMGVPLDLREIDMRREERDGLNRAIDRFSIFDNNNIC